MTGPAFTLSPVASYANEQRRLVLEFDDTDENRRLVHLVFEAAIKGDPLVLRPNLETEFQALKFEADRLRSALKWMRRRDDINGSLPQAYRARVDEVLAEPTREGGVS